MRETIEQELVVVDGLLQVGVGAELGRLDGVADGPEGRDDDDLRAGPELAEPGQDLEPGNVGEVHVEQDDVGLEEAGLLETQAAVLRGGHLEAVVARGGRKRPRGCSSRRR